MKGSLDEALIVADTLATRTLRRMAPCWGWCIHCGIPWAYAEHHSTQYRECKPGQVGRACFPLCVDCWDTLGAEAKLHAYRVYAEQVDALNEWPEIAAALAAELGHQ